MKDDTISRQAAVDAIQKHSCNTQRIIDAVEALPSAQPEKRTDKRTETHACDFISRQMAIEAIQKLPNAGIHWFVSAEAVFDVLLKLPSAQPKAIRPKFVAEDRYVTNYFQTFPHCPKCNYEVETGDCYCRVCGCRIDWSEDYE